MENKFIKLTSRFGPSSIYINALLISAIEPTPGGAGSTIYSMASPSHAVTESPEEILKQIKKTNSYTITYDQPG